MYDFIDRQYVATYNNYYKACDGLVTDPEENPQAISTRGWSAFRQVRMRLRINLALSKLITATRRQNAPLKYKNPGQYLYLLLCIAHSERKANLILDGPYQGSSGATNSNNNTIKLIYKWSNSASRILSSLLAFISTSFYTLVLSSLDISIN
jgi:hypothetical protein